MSRHIQYPPRTRNTRRQNKNKFGPMHPADVYLPPGYDTEYEANKARDGLAKAIVEIGFADIYGVYVRPVTRHMWAVYVGRHDHESMLTPNLAAELSEHMSGKARR